QWHSFPLPGCCGFQNRIGDLIGSQSISKGGGCLFAFAGCLEKICELVCERVLISDLQAGHPPMLHIRMVPVRNVHASPAARLAFIAMIEVLYSMQVMKIPHSGRMLAVDFERI